MTNEVWKHPDATQDIHCPWFDKLQIGETIIQSRWAALGLTIVVDQIVADGVATVAWIAGGFHNSRYYVTNAVITNRGHTLMKDVILHVSDDAPLPESSL